MVETQEQPEVFISYSHKDEVWKDRLLPHLGALEKADKLTVWDDRQIDAGDTWYPEITEAMKRAKVAVLLISADYLNSNFCVKEEALYLLGEQRKEHRLFVIPVLIRPCAFEAIDWLHPIQMLPRDGKSVSEDFADNYDGVFTDVARCVLEAIKPLSAVGHASWPLFEARTPKWPALGEDAVDITRLPVTGAELFGRKKLLKDLDEAWSAKELNVLSLVAWGGVGKSTLVNRWIERMAADNYRGAKRVFGWSFYSQGTNERVTSADRFINKALEWFGDDDPTAGSPWSKGERLAKLIAKERTLLILDGMEPLQSPRDVDKGHVKDPALMMMLRGLAEENAGLCIISTREPVTDLAGVKTGVAKRDLEEISPEAGRALLRVRGIRGSDADLEAATEEFGGHALAVNLLASYLHGIPGHPIAAAKDIPDLDIPIEKGRYARRVIAAFESRFGAGPEVEMLRVLGLFDRPATKPEVDAVLAEPPIDDLTARLNELAEVQRGKIVEKLRDLGLLARRSLHAHDELDAHPLVREHFGEQLQRDHPQAWRAGHERLYEYLQGPGCEKAVPDTAEEMAPLYTAVFHGCAAGRHQEVYREVFLPRLRRGNTAYSLHMLGAFGADLGALAGLFEEPWCRPVASLSEAVQGFVLNEAGIDLRALGRLTDALEPMLAGLEAAEMRQDWTDAGQGAQNIGELYLMLGRTLEAIDSAKQSVDFADRGTYAYRRVDTRAALADTFHQAGRASEAEALFQEAERLHKVAQSDYPILFSLPGYQYCDLLLAQRDHQGVIERATNTLEIAKLPNWLVAIALDRVSLGRAYLLAAQADGKHDSRDGRKHIDQAVEGLREAGTAFHLPCGLLARAELYLFTGDHAGALADLDEAMDIATRDPAGHMKLFVTDCRLGYARLALAEKKPDVAREQLAKARALIEETGYHRRDAELAELERAVESPSDPGT